MRRRNLEYAMKQQESWRGRDTGEIQVEVARQFGITAWTNFSTTWNGWQYRGQKAVDRHED